VRGHHRPGPSGGGAALRGTLYSHEEKGTWKVSTLILHQRVSNASATMQKYARLVL
jgi:hypothetical protein